MIKGEGSADSWGEGSAERVGDGNASVCRQTAGELN